MHYLIRMAIHIVRLGTPRAPSEGPRLGTVRRPPRGVRKEDHARRDFYDQWLPELAPSDALLSWVKAEPMTDARWTRFAREYRREMSEAVPTRLLGLLALLSRSADLAVGCYCEDEARCHRSVLRDLLAEAGADVAAAAAPRATDATPSGSTTAATGLRPPRAAARPRRSRAR